MPSKVKVWWRIGLRDESFEAGILMQCSLEFKLEFQVLLALTGRQQLGAYVDWGSHG